MHEAGYTMCQCASAHAVEANKLVAATLVFTSLCVHEQI